MTEDAAPVLVDPRVTTRTVAGSTAAALGFSGNGFRAAFAKRNRDLQDAIAAAGLEALGPPRFARFDPPFKPWFLRHNEVLQNVAQSQSQSQSPGRQLRADKSVGARLDYRGTLSGQCEGHFFLEIKGKQGR